MDVMETCVANLERIVTVGDTSQSEWASQCMVKRVMYEYCIGSEHMYRSI